MAKCVGMYVNETRTSLPNFSGQNGQYMYTVDGVAVPRGGYGSQKVPSGRAAAAVDACLVFFPGRSCLSEEDADDDEDGSDAAAATGAE